MKPQRGRVSKTSSNSGTKRKPALAAKPLPRSSRSVRTMGLDLSLTGTGLVVWDGTKVLRWRLLQTEPLTKEGQSQGLLASGKFRGHLEDRIEWQRQRIATTFRKFSPDLVIVEEYAFGARGRGLSGLHELGGVIKNHFFRKNAVYLSVHNSVIKEYATGKGGASKLEMIQAASEHWPNGPWTTRDCDNVADAFWLATWGHFHIDTLTTKVPKL